MKKIAFFLLATILMCNVMSCKTREKCPAYGKATTHTSAKAHA